MNAGALYRDGTDLGLRPKTFRTLVHLVANKGALVSKAELLETIWSDAAVTDDVLVQSIADLRRILGDDARRPTFIRTVPRRGYIFIRDVCVETESAAPLESASGRSAPDERSPSPPADRDPPRPEGRSAAHVAARRLGRLLPWAAVLILAALLAYWKLPIGAAGRDSDSPASPLEATVAIVPFEVRSQDKGSEWLRAGIPDLISNGLRQSEGLGVISRHPLLESASGADGQGPPDEDLALSAARSLGAQRVVLGSFYRLGRSIQINARLIDVSQGASQPLLRTRLQSLDEIFATVDRICQRILESLAIERGLRSSHGLELQELTTDSLEAYRHYISGLEWFVRGGPLGADRARIELERAIRIDPAFALARFKLAQVQHWAQFRGYAKSDSLHALREAVPYLEGLSERDGLLLKGLKALEIDGDPRTALSIWDGLEKRYPVFSAQAGVPVLRTRLRIEDGELQRAIEAGRPFLDNVYLTDSEKSRLHFYLATAYRNRGDLEQAIRLAERGIELFPAKDSRDHLYFVISLGRYYLDADQRRAALESFRTASQAARGDPAIATDAAWGFYMAGDKETALQAAEAALEVDPSFGNAHHLAGWIRLSRGEHSQAADHLERAFELTPGLYGWNYHGILQADLPALYYAGVARQLAGERLRAQSNFERVIEACRVFRNRWDDRGRPAFDRIQTFAYEAIAHCRLGDFQQCLRLAEQVPTEAAQHYELRHHLARLNAQLGKPKEALEWLRRSLDAGYRDFQHALDNPDFKELRGSREFLSLLGPDRPRP